MLLKNKRIPKKCQVFSQLLLHNIFCYDAAEQNISYITRNYVCCTISPIKNPHDPNNFPFCFKNSPDSFTYNAQPLSGTSTPNS